jgi:hypothetical protein
MVRNRVKGPEVHPCPLRRPDSHGIWDMRTNDTWSMRCRIPAHFLPVGFTSGSTASGQREEFPVVVPSVLLRTVEISIGGEGFGYVYKFHNASLPE